MSFDCREYGNITVITTRNVLLDECAMSEIEKQVALFLKSKKYFFVIQGMDKFKGDALRGLVSTWKLVYNQNGSLRFCEVAPWLVDMFGQLNTVFQIYRTIEDATNSFVDLPSSLTDLSVQLIDIKLDMSLVVTGRYAENYFELTDIRKEKLFTVVASQIPFIFFGIATMEVGTMTPLAKLTKSLETQTNYKDIPDETTGYATILHSCNKLGLVKDHSEPLLQLNYTNLDDAINGHLEVVKRFSKGAPLYSPSGLLIR